MSMEENQNTISEEPEKSTEDQSQEIQNPTAQKKSSPKKTFWKVVFFIILFGLTFFAVFQITSSLSGGSVASFQKVISQLHPGYFVLMIGVAILLIFSNALIYSVLAKICNGKFDYITCLKNGIIGKFYDNITPFSTGGQPFQAYYFHNKGYRSDVATSIPVVKYIIQLVSWIFVSLILYIANHNVLDTLPQATKLTVKITTYVGIGIACLAPIIVVLFSIFPKFTSKILAFFIKLGVKLKLIHHPDKIIAKIEVFIENYSFAFQSCFKRLTQILFVFLICIVDFLITMSLPFFVLIAIGGVEPSLKLAYDVITLNAYSLFAASLIPTPGNTGAIETAYSMVFSTATPDTSILVYIVFVWRFLTYYIYILFGVIRFIYRFIRDMYRKHKKSKSIGA